MPDDTCVVARLIEQEDAATESGYQYACGKLTEHKHVMLPYGVLYRAQAVLRGNMIMKLCNIERVIPMHSGNSRDIRRCLGSYSGHSEN